MTLRMYGGGPDESQFIANKGGYLRFAIELLKAALAPVGAKSQPNAVHVDLGYLVTSDSDVGFDWFERREDIPAPPTRESVGSWILKVAMLGILVGVLGFALLGFVTSIRWLIGTF